MAVFDCTVRTYDALFGLMWFYGNKFRVHVVKAFDVKYFFPHNYMHSLPIMGLEMELKSLKWKAVAIKFESGKT